MDNPDTTTIPMRSITIQVPDLVAQKMAETYDGTLEDAALAGLRLIHGMGSPAYTTLQELAKQLGTSVPKTLRTAIAEFQAQTARLALTPQVGRPKVNEERDAAIFKRVSKGATYAEVASSFSLSLVRVGQIMAQQRASRGVSSRRGRVVVPHDEALLPSAELEARRNFTDKTNHADMLMRMGAGMSAAEAAAEYGMSEAQVTAAYTAYCDALQDASKINQGARATAVFAGLHALEQPVDQEVLSLNVPPKPRYVMPGLTPRRTEPDDGLTAVQRNVFTPEFGF
jgi:transposase